MIKIVGFKQFNFGQTNKRMLKSIRNQIIKDKLQMKCLINLSLTLSENFDH